MQQPGQGALWGLGPAGQREHPLASHQPGRSPAARCGPANSHQGAPGLENTKGSGDLWGFVAIGLQLNLAPRPGQVVRAFRGVVRDLGLPVEAARVEFVRYTAPPGSRSLAHLRLPPALARALLAARCRLAAVHPDITLDLYRKREELLYIREARDQRAPQRQAASAPAAAAGRADAAATWVRAPVVAQRALLAPSHNGTSGNGTSSGNVSSGNVSSGTSGSIGDPYDSGLWGERAFLALAPSNTAAGGNVSSGNCSSGNVSSGASGSIGDPYDSGLWGERAFLALAPSNTAAGGSSDGGSGSGQANSDSDGTHPSQAAGASCDGSDSDGDGSSQGSSAADAVVVEGGRGELAGAGSGEGEGTPGDGRGAAGEREAGAGLAGEPGQPTTSDEEQQLPVGWCLAECIVAQRERRWGNASGSGRTLQYSVRFAGHGPEADEWIKADRVSRPLLAAWESRQQRVAAPGGREAPASAGGAEAPSMAGDLAPAAAQSAGAGEMAGGAASRRSGRLQAAALASQ